MLKPVDDDFVEFVVDVVAVVFDGLLLLSSVLLLLLLLPCSRQLAQTNNF